MQALTAGGGWLPLFVLKAGFSEFVNKFIGCGTFYKAMTTAKSSLLYQEHLGRDYKSMAGIQGIPRKGVPWILICLLTLLRS